MRAQITNFVIEKIEINWGFQAWLIRIIDQKLEIKLVGGLIYKHFAIVKNAEIGKFENSYTLAILPWSGLIEKSESQVRERIN